MAYELVECYDAEEFWDKLNPLNPLGLGWNISKKLIYRGHGESEWKLLPTVYRKDKNPSFLISGETDLPTTEIQIKNEWRVLEQFIKGCDKTGIKIPNDNMDFRNKLFYNENCLDQFYMEPKTWPSKEYHEILALAQHHGLPTRLLDWSHRSYIAAYFAASYVIKKGDYDGDLSVWVANKKIIKKSMDIDFIELPTSISVNIAAQSGVFTVVKYDPDDRISSLLPTLDIFLSNNDIWKITLDKKYAPKILKYCESYGISAATLFPGIKGVIQFVYDSFGSLRKQSSEQRMIAKRKRISDLIHTNINEPLPLSEGII